MGKTKQRNHRPDEFLLQQVRHYRKEIKRKDQRIKQLEKELGYKQNQTNELFEEFIKEDPDLCPECKIGSLREIIIVGRSIKTCDQCMWRTRAKKI